jgi:hypothetical protein
MNPTATPPSPAEVHCSPMVTPTEITENDVAVAEVIAS